MKCFFNTCFTEINVLFCLNTFHDLPQTVPTYKEFLERIAEREQISLRCRVILQSMKDGKTTYNASEDP